jgi:twinkle protein
MVTAELIAQIKQTANVAETVGRYLNLKRNGTNLTCFCPFHNEKSGSFTVSKQKNIYKCFGCGETGDSIEFLIKFKKIKFIEALQELADYYHIEMKTDSPDVKKVYVKPKPRQDNLSPEAIKFFEKRGILQQTLSDLKVTGCYTWMPVTENNTDTICFNYYKDGELTNIKYRAALSKNFKLEKDAELIFYNLDCLKNTDTVVIVEGEIDALTVYQCGYKNVLSVPNGAQPNGKLEYMDNCFEQLRHVKKAILFVDNDTPGKQLQKELVVRLGAERCHLVNYPIDTKDANDIFTKLGKQQVIECIKNATEYPLEGIISAEEICIDIDDFYFNGYPDGTKAGIIDFDDHLQFMGGQFTTVTGVPRSGKSEFIDYIMAKLSKNHGWRHGVVSFENQPSSLHATKVMEKIVGKSFNFRFDPNHRITIAEKDKAKKFISEHYFFINVNKADLTLDGILDKAKDLVTRKGIKCLLIDPWNYIEHKYEAYKMSETQYISDCLTKIKAFCLINNIHIFLVAHPTKMPKVNGKFEVPNLYNISGSAHFFNKTDNGITVHRDVGSSQVDVYIQKVRYSWLGREGMVSFNFNLDTRQYENGAVETNDTSGTFTEKNYYTEFERDIMPEKDQQFNTSGYQLPRTETKIPENFFTDF